MSVRSTIIDEALKIAREQGAETPLLTDDLPLVDTGLNSLSISVLVVRLEEKLTMNPFDDAENVAFPVTFGDFIRLYEESLQRP